SGIGNSNCLRANLWREYPVAAAISPTISGVSASTVIKFKKKFTNFTNGFAYQLTSNDKILIQVKKATGAYWSEWETVQTVDITNHTPSAEFSTVQTSPLGITYAATVIKVRLYVTGTLGNNFYLDIDDFEVYVPIEYDLAAGTITGQTGPSVDTPVSYVVTVQNNGANIATNWSVKLMQVGAPAVLLTTVLGHSLTPGNSTSIDIDYTFTTLGVRQIYGEIDWTVDMDASNDTTPLLEVNAQMLGSAMIEIGTGTASNYTTPIDYFHKHNVTQTIILGSQIGVTGTITQLAYHFHRSDVSYPPIGGAPVKFYLANLPATTTAFANTMDWINVSLFTEVWSGSLPVQADGVYWVDIPLQTAFEYVGGNLAIMSYRPMDNAYYHLNNQWRYTESESGRNATLYYYSDYVEGNPDTGNLNLIGTLAIYYANTKLTIGAGGVGNLTGIVTNGIIPLAGVEVTILGSPANTTTNTNGRYTIQNIPAGNVTMTAQRHNYYDYTSENVTITEGELTTHNFALTPLSNVSLSGFVYASDTGNALADCDISLTGIDDYHGITTDQIGFYHIPTVFVNRTYTLTVQKGGYVTHIDDNILVLNADLVLPDITLLEKASPPRNVVATAVGRTVFIAWNAPLINSRELLSYTLYRTDESNIHYPTEWTFIADNITDTAYLHINGMQIEQGAFYYAVEAVYTHNNTSEAVLSNIINCVSENDEAFVSLITTLIGNYPNPFNPSTMIVFDKANDGKVLIEIYNLKGQKVKTLIDRFYTAGKYTVEWNGLDTHNAPCSSGLYFYRMQTEDKVLTKKMVLLK
ncbi:MAG: carboxypeptidase regulatory-like domain-containing protein, partial [Candidatus Cloacimonetes bacterium]|nr:carboxypeptidase regulatory-like domain-containing protein [Candidatus Cloacimonadota bacterium]